MLRLLPEMFFLNGFSVTFCEKKRLCPDAHQNSKLHGCWERKPRESFRLSGRRLLREDILLWGGSTSMKLRRNGTECSQDDSKSLEREEPDGHWFLHLCRGISFNAEVLAVFNAESERTTPAHHCASVTDSVHVQSVAFSNFKLIAFVGMAPYHGSVSIDILDTCAGHKLVHKRPCTEVDKVSETLMYKN